MGDTICRVYGNLIIAGDNHCAPSNVSQEHYIVWHTQVLEDGTVVDEKNFAS